MSTFQNGTSSQQVVAERGADDTVSVQDRPNRRSFLNGAGMAALAGAAGFRNAAEFQTKNAAAGKYDFDTPYKRVGTDCVKWDRQIRLYGQHIVAGMGVADMDFRCAPAITKALA